MEVDGQRSRTRRPHPTCTGTPCAGERRRASATGCMVPTSLFAQRVVTRATSSRERRLGMRRSTRPSGIHGEPVDDRALVGTSHSSVSMRRVVLGAGCDDVRSRYARSAGYSTPGHPGAVGGPAEALDGEVDRLGAARGEDDLDRVGAERRRERSRASSSIRFACLAVGVDRRGVADQAQRVGVRGQHLGRHGRRRGVVEVDRHGSITLERMPDPPRRPRRSPRRWGRHAAGLVGRRASKVELCVFYDEGPELDHASAAADQGRSRRLVGDDRRCSSRARATRSASTGRRARRTSSTRSCTSSTLRPRPRSHARRRLARLRAGAGHLRLGRARRSRASPSTAR